MGTQLVYTVVKPTGQFNDEGEEFVILVGHKLTRVAADALAVKNVGSKVLKSEVDKRIE